VKLLLFQQAWPVQETAPLFEPHQHSLIDPTAPGFGKNMANTAKKFHLESRERAVEGKRSICANRSNCGVEKCLKCNSIHLADNILFPNSVDDMKNAPAHGKFFFPHTLGK
jgi:hypothetical protein